MFGVAEAVFASIGHRLRDAALLFCYSGPLPMCLAAVSARLRRQSDVAGHPEMSMKMRRRQFSPTVATHSTQKMSSSNKSFNRRVVAYRPGRVRHAGAGQTLLFLGSVDSMRTSVHTALSTLCRDDHTHHHRFQRSWITFVCWSRIRSNEEACVSTLGPVTLAILHTQGAMAPILPIPSHKCAAGVLQASK